MLFSLLGAPISTSLKNMSLSQLCYRKTSPLLGCPGGSDSKESACNAGDQSSIPGLERFPGEGATHASVLAWRIPWTQDPGWLQSMGSQRVRHD